MSIFRELQRRNVIRIAVLYVVGSWLVLQVGDLLFDLMGLPDWALRIVLGILLLGFPMALVAAWVFEITPEGVQRDQGPGSVVSDPATSNKLNVAVIVTVVLAVAVLLGDRYLGRPDGVPTAAPAETAGAAAQLATPDPVDEPTAVPDDASVAVLPFLNLSPDPEQEYFSDGLADTLLHRLAQVPDLRVAARTSAFQFKGRNMDVREIAGQLGVATVLEGSVQRQGARIRITAQLISGHDGSHLWSSVFDDTLDDIFRVQDEISGKVMEALTTTLLQANAGTGAAADLGGTQVVAAYEAYLRGRAALDRGTPEGANEAVVQLELATELDPAYALAWAALVDAHGATARLGTVAWEATAPLKLEAAQRAVELAPDLVDSQLALADAYESVDRFAEADAAVERAFELGPNNAAAVRAMAQVTRIRGHLRDALRLTERAVLLDPLDPGLQMNLAQTRLGIGNLEGSLALARDVVASNPDNLELRAQRAWLLARAGNPVDSMRELQAILKDGPDYLRSFFFISSLWLQMGDGERALDFLERAEAIAPDRAYDDRMDLCYVTGDTDCYRASAERLIAYLRETGNDLRADLIAGQLAVRSGRPEDAIEILEPLIMDDGEVDLDSYSDAGALALAYDRTGNRAGRDRILDAIEAELSRRVANGLWQTLTVNTAVRVATMRGDHGRALDLLSDHVDSVLPPTSLELLNEFQFEALRAHPRFPELLRRKQAQEAAWRDAVDGGQEVQ